MTSIAKKSRNDERETVEVEWVYNPDLDKIGTREPMDVDDARVWVAEGRARYTGPQAAEKAPADPAGT